MSSGTKLDVWNLALDKIGENDALESEDEDRLAAEVCRRHWDRVLREALEARQWTWARRQREITDIGEQSASYDGDGTTVEFEIPYSFLDTSQLEVVLVAASGAEAELDSSDYTLTLASAGVNASLTMGVAPAIGETLRVTVITSRIGWEYVYPLPVDCVAPIALLTEDTRLSLVPHESRIRFEVLPDDAGEGLLLCCDVAPDDFERLEYVYLCEYAPLWPAQFEEALACRLASELALSITKDRALAAGLLAAHRDALDRASVNASNLGNDESHRALTPSIAARG